MKTYENTYSTTRPSTIETTLNKVFIASDIQETTRIVEGIEENCYKYTLKEYDKDEYITLLAAANLALEDELQATKILLGVE